MAGLSDNIAQNSSVDVRRAVGAERNSCPQSVVRQAGLLDSGVEESKPYDVNAKLFEHS
jgi:hypothetical protein